MKTYRKYVAEMLKELYYTAMVETRSRIDTSNDILEDPNSTGSQKFVYEQFLEIDEEYLDVLEDLFEEVRIKEEEK